MNKLLISGNQITLLKKKPKQSLATVYGVGRVRADKILSILLTNPFSKEFRKDLVMSSQELSVQRLFKALTADLKLKLLIYSNLEKLARISCYRARRMLQNLPSKGQRTHTNAGTPNKYNPFVYLGVKPGLTTELINNNKNWELSWNGRTNIKLVVSGRQSTKYSKKASQQKKLKQQQKKLNQKEKKQKKNEKIDEQELIKEELFF